MEPDENSIYQSQYVAIDIRDEEPEEDEKDDELCCIMKCLTNWFVPIPYASWCEFGCFRCCEATSQSEHIWIVQSRLMCLWIVCALCILLPLFLREAVSMLI
jgi:hypothetical protein